MRVRACVRACVCVCVRVCAYHFGHALPPAEHLARGDETAVDARVPVRYALCIHKYKRTVHILCLYGDTVHLSTPTCSERTVYARGICTCRGVCT